MPANITQPTPAPSPSVPSYLLYPECPGTVSRAVFKPREDGRYDVTLPGLTLELIGSLADGLRDRAACYRQLWEGTGDTGEAEHIALASECESLAAALNAHVLAEFRASSRKDASC